MFDKSITTGKTVRFCFFTASLFILFLPDFLRAEDFTLLGGDLTNSIPGRNGIQAPAPNLSSGPLKDLQVAGFGPFHLPRTRKSGLGPHFVNESCGGCHVGNGRGRVRRVSAPQLNALVIKVGLQGLFEDGAPIPVPGIGDLLQERSTSDRSRSRFKRAKVRWKRSSVSYPDGRRVLLRRPLLQLRLRGYQRKDLVYSLRMTPGIIGPGLLQSIPDETLEGWADPEDRDNDGISGRLQYVPDIERSQLAIGRFGFRASQPTVKQQSAGAAKGEMGVSSPLFPEDDASFEMSEQELVEIDIYQRLAGVPRARKQETPAVQRGAELFLQVGCENCHKVNILTSNHEFSELHHQIIHPFTDLLLHDMGDGLADTRPEYEASGREWKTSPLWGLGFLPTVSRVKQHYLHDGRARTVEEAILWHGGESEGSRSMYMNLSNNERLLLLQFLETL